ncbi:MAG: hypothetical protein NY202_01180 [Mollicutes bacterium UO1]
MIKLKDKLKQLESTPNNQQPPFFNSQTLYIGLAIGTLIYNNFVYLLPS